MCLLRQAYLRHRAHIVGEAMFAPPRTPLYLSFPPRDPYEVATAVRCGGRPIAEGRSESLTDWAGLYFCEGELDHHIIASLRSCLWERQSCDVSAMLRMKECPSPFKFRQGCRGVRVHPTSALINNGSSME